jgi:hypothetical protein
MQDAIHPSFLYLGCSFFSLRGSVLSGLAGGGGVSFHGKSKERNFSPLQREEMEGKEKEKKKKERWGGSGTEEGGAIPQGSKATLFPCCGNLEKV